MRSHALSTAEYTEDDLTDERQRLVRLCAYLTGDADAAEDLAQETLIEAWRNIHKLTDPCGRARWHSAIARNVCLRHLRRRGRESERSIQSAESSAMLDVVPDGFDLEIELERNELARLLDRALALLSTETRAIMIGRFIEEFPIAEVASRLGLSEGAVTMRIQRGKLQLRRVLNDELQQEASAFGIHFPTDSALEATNIWCPICGTRRLIGGFDAKRGELLLRCTHCVGESNTALMCANEPTIFRGVQTIRPALNRFTAWAHAYYQRALTDRVAPCLRCGKNQTVRHTEWTSNPAPFSHGLALRCEHCGETGESALCGIVLCQPAAWRFWRDHPRIQITEQSTEYSGRPAIVVSFASVTSNERLDIVTCRETFQVLHMDGDAHAN